MMKRVALLGIALVAGLISFPVPSSYATWTWTPEAGWAHPRQAVRSSSREQFAWAEKLFQKGEYDKAIAEYRKLLRSYPESIYAPRSQYAIGASYEALGKYCRAAEEYQRVIDDHPDSDKMADIVENQHRLGNLIFAEKIESRFKRIFRESNYEKAARIYRLVVSNAPHGERAAEAQYKIGLSYYRQGRFPEAVSEFQKVIENFPQSLWIENAYRGIGLSYLSQSLPFPYDQTLAETALRQFQEFRKRFPDSKLIPEVEEKVKLLRERNAERLYRIARFYKRGGHIRAAVIYYQAIIRKYPQSDWAVFSRERLSELQEKDN
ncbi:outer membrane protein assembly factor BamD [candidate division NPL-UPA2 bacterium]|nr:outer membrane protein assembly factor BamD [candidate division NPL-UPA2 bacterium]